MTLTFKHFREVLDDWLGYLVGHSDITDTNPGSLVRTVGEATALTTAQAYVQMQSLLGLFNINKAFGADLDERALDYGLTRIQPAKSNGYVTLGDSNLTVADTAHSTLASGVTAGVSTTAVIQAADYASFPASGTVIFDRGATALREAVAYSSKTAPATLNLATLPAHDHAITTDVYLSTVGSDRPLPIGTEVKTATPEIIFTTTAAATLLDGDYQTTGIAAESLTTGAANKIAASKISAFSTAPFPTATITNPYQFNNGEDLELDDAFKARIKAYFPSLSSSTKARIEYEALRVVVASTGQRVVSARLVEPIAPGEMTLYIHDGSATYAPTTADVNAHEFLISAARAGQRRAGLLNWPIADYSEILCVSEERGVSTSVGALTLIDTTKVWTPNAYAWLRLKDATNALFLIASNTTNTLTLVSGTPSAGAYSIIDINNTIHSYSWGWWGGMLTRDVDYTINYTNGQIELDATIFPTGLNANDCMLAYYDGAIASYSYYDGLVQEAQHVINGDPSNISVYPGVKAAGSKVKITAPTTVTVTVLGSIQPNIGIDESTLTLPVSQAILAYVNGLPVGANVIRAEMIAAAMGIPGVADFTLAVPATNIAVNDSSIAKTSLTYITVT